MCRRARMPPGTPNSHSNDFHWRKGTVSRGDADAITLALNTCLPARSLLVQNNLAEEKLRNYVTATNLYVEYSVVHHTVQRRIHAGTR